MSDIAKMADRIELRGGDTSATINYLRNPATDDPSITMVYDPLTGEETTMRLAPVEVALTDARKNSGDFSLDREGFVLIPHRCDVTDFLDRSQTGVIYPREAAALICELTGAFTATGMGSNVRFGSSRPDDYTVTTDHNPARFAHADFTPVSAVTARDSIGAVPEKYSRWALYNVWQVWSEPPQDQPLAVCDARSVSSDDRDVVQIRLKAPGLEVVRSETTVFYPNPAHKWYYFSNMTINEKLIFKGFDSDPDRPMRLPHTSFVNQLAGPDAIRKSIETRVVAFFN